MYIYSCGIADVGGSANLHRALGPGNDWGCLRRNHVWSGPLVVPIAQSWQPPPPPTGSPRHSSPRSAPRHPTRSQPEWKREDKTPEFPTSPSEHSLLRAEDQLHVGECQAVVSSQLDRLGQSRSPGQEEKCGTRPSRPHQTTATEAAASTTCGAWPP